MDDKQQVRERVWELLTRERIARSLGARGRIPNFFGAEAADAVVHTRAPRHPPGILWDQLDDQRRAAMPVLASRRRINVRDTSDRLR